MANAWSINEDVVIPFENYDPRFEGVQPIFADESCLSETEISPWTNRVPEHEPWPRVMKQDSDDEVNTENDGYLNNVDWIDQYDNQSSPEGLEPIGKVEGDETNDRGQLWRR